MNESRKEYQDVVRREVVRLERSAGKHIQHGQGGVCPRCARVGRFDLEGLGFAQGFGNSIYFSTVYHGWRCRRCDYRMVA